MVTQRREDSAKALGGCLGQLLGALIFVAAQAWILMLGLGVLHSQWPQIPAPGFWAVLVVIFMVNVVARWIRRLSAKEK